MPWEWRQREKEKKRRGSSFIPESVTWVAEKPRASCLSDFDYPPLPDADDHERNDGPDDEEANNRHEAVDVPPPTGALVPRLVDEQRALGGIEPTGSEATLALASHLQHVQLRIRRQG